MRRRVPLNTKLCLCDFAGLLLQGMFRAPGEAVVEFEKEKKPEISSRFLATIFSVKQNLVQSANKVVTLADISFRQGRRAERDT
jgi:hypothetical protein